MSEEEMVASMEGALRELGVPEKIAAVGQFQPRGHTGSMFAGGLIGDSLTSSLGGLGDAVGTIGGAMAGSRIHDASSGLPANMMVGVSDTHVYGFSARGRRVVENLVFRVDRQNLTVKVHQRVNVRILELIDATSGSNIQLEGNRVPLTHSKDVIDVLNV
ncbi:MAG TPA: hypothetical protein VLK34_06475 [Nocardioidaceae bacterium]|nr:hypothetical protein [Nocardioidaceae bacterium]